MLRYELYHALFFHLDGLLLLSFWYNFYFYFFAIPGLLSVVLPLVCIWFFPFLLFITSPAHIHDPVCLFHPVAFSCISFPLHDDDRMTEHDEMERCRRDCCSHILGEEYSTSLTSSSSPLYVCLFLPSPFLDIMLSVCFTVFY